MIFDLKQTAKERIIVVAHRGTAGGNIPCNTLAAYEIAIRHGADMVEVDVDKAADGTLFIFHPKMEKPLLCYDGSIRELTKEQISSLRYVNVDNTPTEHGLCTLDEALDLMKGRCYINIDKFWENPIEISDTLRRHNMLDQVVVKTSPKPKFLDIIEEYASEVPYLPILKNKDGGVHEDLKRRKINYVGAELVFDTEDAEIVGDDYLNLLRRDGKLLWGNAILYNYKVPLAAGHSDDISLTKNPDEGWGWLADRGFDIIQTDWPLALNQYLTETGRKYKK